MTKPHKIKSALIVEGGAMRSVFSAGLLDGFLEKNFNPFDFYIGVSAGAVNLLSYMTSQAGQSLHFYKNIASSHESINYRRFLCGGHLIDLDWIARRIANEIGDKLQDVDFQAKPFLVGATDIHSGQAVYIPTTADNYKSSIKASTALPLFYNGFPEINSQPMTDGGVADGIPVAEAIAHGATHIMVIRSRHKHYLKSDSLWHRYIRWRFRHYKELTNTMRERVNIHRRVISLIRNPPDGIKIVEISPPESLSIGRFSRNPEKLQSAYRTGISMSNNAIQRWDLLQEIT